MSISRAAQIMAAVETALSVPHLDSLPAEAVYTNLLVPLERQALPALVIEMGDEPAPAEEGRSIGYCDRTLEIVVSVLVDAAAPYTAADPIVVDAFDRLVADRTLGGLCLYLSEGGTTRSRHDSGVGLVTTTWLATYRTGRDSLNLGD
jgi:hypothetical protein